MLYKNRSHSNLVHYITMNHDGLRDAIVAILGGHRVKVNTFSYENDMMNFKDMVFVPLPGRNKPAMVVELKWNKKCETALDQIRDKKKASKSVVRDWF